ncbi:MAG: DUF1326 domain-containing protein [Pirellulaceae bacterium]|nr:DUF1326 domain-containing protein [Pirellulaceae bacterium]
MMRHALTWGLLACFALLACGRLSAAEIRGTYLETRTCQVYTGPCFANAEVGLAGKEAIMAWQIQQGERNGIDLSGLNVVVVVRSSHTLAFRGLADAQELKSVVLLDERATADQRDALLGFVREHAGPAGREVVGVSVVPIQMSLDTAELQGNLSAGKVVKLSTRKARPSDCICSNESAYYPPLARVENFAPGVTLEGSFTGRGLGTRWSTPDARSAYMATFAY